MEVMYFRLDTTEASQNATFSDVRPHTLPELYSANHWLGYEIPVCLFRTEAWIVETENSTRTAELSRSIGKAATIDDPLAQQGHLSGGDASVVDGLPRLLTSQGKRSMYVGAYFASVNTWRGVSRLKCRGANCV
jgi:hypothetical protein